MVVALHSIQAFTIQDQPCFTKSCGSLLGTAHGDQVVSIFLQLEEDGGEILVGGDEDGGGWRRIFVSEFEDPEHGDLAGFVATTSQIAERQITVAACVLEIISLFILGLLYLLGRIQTKNVPGMILN
ncbi:hypothetical protein MLD38_036031 [Melastoma candidum]|uniref:Uncharacterized protein n=1 Tax=Melastoma candidum TaxID=119954 RepID=A0ACB9LIU5_9MYRT|nr:hypothetical protein MLD38_036031 [Melastoma candidum]